MYQFLVTSNVEIPFTLFSTIPKQEIPVTSGDKLSDSRLRGTTIVVEKSDMDFNTFLDLLLEVIN